MSHACLKDISRASFSRKYCRMEGVKMTRVIFTGFFEPFYPAIEGSKLKKKKRVDKHRKITWQHVLWGKAIDVVITFHSSEGYEWT